MKLGRADEFEGIQNTDDSSQCGQGLIEFDNVTARYPLRFDIILKNVTFQIMPGQHVAIVGRTGSGKSSLIMSLFRMLENLDGSVFIDGQDVTQVPLSVHRSRLTIIPQVMSFLLLIQWPKSKPSLNLKQLFTTAFFANFDFEPF